MHWRAHGVSRASPEPAGEEPGVFVVTKRNPQASRSKPSPTARAAAWALVASRHSGLGSIQPFSTVGRSLLSLSTATASTTEPHRVQTNDLPADTSGPILKRRCLLLVRRQPTVMIQLVRAPSAVVRWPRTRPCFPGGARGRSSVVFPRSVFPEGKGQADGQGGFWGIRPLIESRAQDVRRKRLRGHTRPS